MPFSQSNLKVVVISKVIYLLVHHRVTRTYSASLTNHSLQQKTHLENYSAKSLPLEKK